MTASYASITDLRTYGIAVSQTPDSQATDLLEIASRIVDDYTGWGGWKLPGAFAATTATTITVSDVRQPMLVLPRPFSAVTAVAVNTRTLDPSAYIIEPWGVRLYVPGVVDADGFAFRSYSAIGPFGGFNQRPGTPFGSQVAVSATFGYSAVPSPVRRATILITAYLVGQEGGIPLERRIQRLAVEGYLLMYDDKGSDTVTDTTGVVSADQMLSPYRMSSVLVG